MPKGVAKGKRLIMVPSDVIAKLMEISHREGRTFYDYIGEVFEQALRAYELNRPLREIVDFFELMEAQKASGAVVTPIDLLTYLISRLYPREKEALYEKWYKSGKWYGLYLLSRFPEQDPVEAFGRLLEVSRWDLDEVRVTKGGGTVKLRCVSPLLPIENTELLLRFMEGVMHSLGFKAKKKECLKGMILLEFEKI